MTCPFWAVLFDAVKLKLALKLGTKLGICGVSCGGGCDIVLSLSPMLVSEDDGGVMVDEPNVNG